MTDSISWADVGEDSWDNMVEDSKLWADKIEEEEEEQTKSTEKPKQEFSWGPPIAYDDEESAPGRKRIVEEFPLPGTKPESEAPRKYRPPRRERERGDFTGSREVITDLPRGPNTRREDREREYRPRDSYEDRDSHPPRERTQTPFPERPPWTAFIGNLSYRVQEEDIGDFFESKGCLVEDIRLIRDQDGKVKGYGYVEFSDDESLRKALEQYDVDFFSRALRVDVASDRRGRDERPSRDTRESRESRFSAPADGGRWERGVNTIQPRFASGRDKDSSPRRKSPSHEELGKPYKPVREKSSKPSPFGSAKPRDELAIQRKIQLELEAKEKEQARKTKDATGGPKETELPKKTKGLHKTEKLPTQLNVLSGENWRSQQHRKQKDFGGRQERKGAPSRGTSWESSRAGRNRDRPDSHGRRQDKRTDRRDVRKERTAAPRKERKEESNKKETTSAPSKPAASDVNLYSAYLGEEEI